MLLRNLINASLISAEYFIDFIRALKWSKVSPLCPRKKQLHYDILLLAHTVEKGLSVSKPREKFGKSKILNLLTYLKSYKEEWGIFPLEKSYGCLLAYLDWHNSKGIDLGELFDPINDFIIRCENLNLTPRGGIKEVSSFSFQENNTVEDFLKARFSCRRFIPNIIDQYTLKRIIEIARRTPSQCNRQSGRIHYYSNPEQINQLLLLQGGAEGFRASVPNLFVITSEISAWSGFKARSQAYVDGSLLAMQVLNACQSLGLGACPLNLAISNFKEFKICSAGNISKGERLIMMIAFGYPQPDNFVVARSERLDIKDLLNIH